MALINKWIRQSCDNQELLFLHFDASTTSSFTSGVMTWQTEDWLGIRLIDRASRFDGFLVARQGSLARVSRGGPYYEALNAELDKSALPEFSGTSLELVLEQSLQDKEAIWVHDDSSGITKGLIVGYDSECLALSCYTSALQYEGEELILWKDILQLEFGGPDQHLLNKLAKVTQ
jgi:hypothetical protein